METLSMEQQFIAMLFPLLRYMMNRITGEPDLSGDRKR